MYPEDQIGHLQVGGSADHSKIKHTDDIEMQSTRNYDHHSVQVDKGFLVQRLKLYSKQWKSKELFRA